MMVPFDTGAEVMEVMVTFVYDKLCNYCRHCHLLSHLVDDCPQLVATAHKPQGPNVPAQVKPSVQRQLTFDAGTKEPLWEVPRKTARRDGSEKSGQQEYAPTGRRQVTNDGGITIREPQVVARNKTSKGNKQTSKKPLSGKPDGLARSVGEKPQHAWPQPLYPKRIDGNNGEGNNGSELMLTGQTSGSKEMEVDNRVPMMDSQVSPLAEDESGIALTTPKEFISLSPLAKSFKDMLLSTPSCKTKSTRKEVFLVGASSRKRTLLSLATQTSKGTNPASGFQGRKTVTMENSKKQGMVALPKPPARSEST